MTISVLGASAEKQRHFEKVKKHFKRMSNVRRKRYANLLKISQMCMSMKWNDMKLSLLSQFLPIMWQIHISQSDSLQSTKDEEDESTGWGEGTHARESEV